VGAWPGFLLLLSVSETRGASSVPDPERSSPRWNPFGPRSSRR